MMYSSRILTATLLVLLCTSNAACSAENPHAALSQGPQCSSSDAQAAEASIDTVSDWYALFEFYGKYAVCDQAAIAEGLDDVVVRLLTAKWGDIALASKISAEHPGFAPFIARHVTELASRDELSAIERHAATECPKDSVELCAELMRTIAKM